MATPPLDPAARFAERLNYLPIAVFGLWLAPIVNLWLQLAGPLLPFGRQPPGLPPLPWFAGAVLAGLAVFLIPRRWYGTAGFEPRLYRRLGILAFRRFATNGDALVRAVRRRHPGYTVHRRDFAKALANTYVGESSHLVCLIFGAVTSAYVVVIGWTGWAAWTIVTNLIANLYPILLQRYTRARLARLGIA
jgi:hypothetical protein